MSTDVQQQNDDYDEQDENCGQQDDDQQDDDQQDDDQQDQQYDDNQCNDNGDGDGDGDGDQDGDDDNDGEEDKEDGPAFIRLRGLPWSATHQEILDFLKNVEVVGGSDGIHLITSRLHGKNTGEAFVHLANQADVKEAHKLNKGLMGHRYIEVFNASAKEAQMVIKKTSHAGQSYVVKLRGLPYACTEQQIEEFFNGLEIKPDREGILFIMDRRGRATGEAFVQFESHEDTEQALGRNREKIGHRYIEIFRSSIAELRRSSTGNDRPGPYDLKDRGGNRGGNYGGGGGSGGFGGGRNNMRGGGDWNNGGFGVGANNTLGFNSLGGYSNSGNFGNGFSGNFGGGNNGNFGNNGGGGFGGNNRFNGPNSGGGGNFSSDFGDFGNFGNNRNNDFSDDNSFGNRGNNSNFGTGGNFGNLGNFGNFGNGGGGGGGSGYNSNMSNNGGGGNFGPIGGGRNDSEYFSVHMRGLPYSSFENDVFKFFDPIRPANVRINFNKKGLHGGTADVYFDTYEDAQLAMKRHKEQMGNRYIELFFDGKVRGNGGGTNSNNNMSNNTFSRRI